MCQNAQRLRDKPTCQTVQQRRDNLGVWAARVCIDGYRTRRPILVLEKKVASSMLSGTCCACPFGVLARVRVFDPNSGLSLGAIRSGP